MHAKAVMPVTATFLTVCECDIGAGLQSFVNVRLVGAEKADGLRPAWTAR
jgi:hypothetical protein